MKFIINLTVQSDVTVNLAGAQPLYWCQHVNKRMKSN